MLKIRTVNIPIHEEDIIESDLFGRVINKQVCIAPLYQEVKAQRKQRRKEVAEAKALQIKRRKAYLESRGLKYKGKMDIEQYMNQKIHKTLSRMITEIEATQKFLSLEESRIVILANSVTDEEVKKIKFLKQKLWAKKAVFVKQCKGYLGFIRTRIQAKFVKKNPSAAYLYPEYSILWKSLAARLKVNKYLLKDLATLPAGTAAYLYNYTLNIPGRLAEKVAEVQLKQAFRVGMLKKPVRNLPWVAGNQDLLIRPKTRKQFWAELLLIEHINPDYPFDKAEDEAKRVQQDYSILQSLLDTVDRHKWISSQSMKKMSYSIDIERSIKAKQWITAKEEHYHKYNPQEDFNDLCIAVFGRKFKDQNIVEALYEDFTHTDKLQTLKTNFKKFHQLYQPGLQQHDIYALALMCIEYSWQSLQWLKTLGTIDTHYRLGRPEAGTLWDKIWSEVQGIPENRIFLLKRNGDLAGVLRKIPLEIDLSRLPSKEIKGLAAKYLYKNVKDQEVAFIASELNRSQSEFEAFQAIWIGRNITRPSTEYKMIVPSLTAKLYESVPCVEAEKNGYKMRRLDCEDPRGLMLGDYVDCCQHLFHAGRTCAVHGTFSPDGAFYVIEKDQKIIAQSWVWRSADILVFDNVEALSDDYESIIVHLYKNVAPKLIGKLCVKEVRLGVNTRDIQVYTRFLKTKNILSPPEGCYSDAKNDQRILARSKDVKD